MGKRTREQAAQLCSIVAASAASGKRHTWCWGTTQAGEAIGASRAVKRLAHLAWAEAVLTAPDVESATRYAEAEALLRCGWSPTDGEP